MHIFWLESVFSAQKNAVFHIFCVILPPNYNCIERIKTTYKTKKLIMQITKVILSVILGAIAATNCFAQRSTINDARDAQAQKQGYYSEPYGFIQVQGGLNTTLSPGNVMKPTFSVAGGYMFTPSVGLRLHANGLTSKNGFHSIGDKYQFKYINTNIDLMVNLTNIGNSPEGLFNLYLVAGTGLAYCWNNDEFAVIANKGVIKEDISNAWITNAHKDLFSHNIRAGLLFDFNISKNFSVGAEFDLNNLSDRFNSKYNDACDWMATGQLSVTYKFGFKEYKGRVLPTPVKEKKVEKKVEKKEEPKPVVVEEPKYETRIDTIWYEDVTYKTIPVEEKIERNVHYKLRQSDSISTSMFKEIAQFVETHKDCKVNIKAYADKGTGNAKLNMKYSQQRAEGVKKELVDKGVPANIITMEWFGDTVQPYATNDENRVAITTAVGMGEKKEKVVTKKFRTKTKQVRVK